MEENSPYIYSQDPELNVYDSSVYRMVLGEDGQVLLPTPLKIACG